MHEESCHDFVMTLTDECSSMAEAGLAVAGRYAGTGFGQGKIDFGRGEVQAGSRRKIIMKPILSIAVGLVMFVAAAVAQGSGITGKVTETMNASGYTYVLLDSGTNKVWAAATRFAVKVGDTVTLGDAVPMSNFRSDTLKRDFALIYFASGAHGEWHQFRPGEITARSSAARGDCEQVAGGRSGCGWDQTCRRRQDCGADLRRKRGAFRQDRQAARQGGEV
jgi:hypothetical protein